VTRGERADAADTMDNWDDAKLNEVVTQNGRKQKNTTDVGVWG
jgi:hypothetical protein